MIESIGILENKYTISKVIHLSVLWKLKFDNLLDNSKFSIKEL